MRGPTLSSPSPKTNATILIRAYYKQLTSDDETVRIRAAKAWSIYEGRTCRLVPDEDLVARTGAPRFAEALARIECHYFVHNAFLRENQLLDGVARIRELPAVIVQGRYDVICPPTGAWELARRWPEAELKLIADAGHSAVEPGILSALVEATDRFARL